MAKIVEEKSANQMREQRRRKSKEVWHRLDVRVSDFLSCYCNSTSTVSNRDPNAHKQHISCNWYRHTQSLRCLTDCEHTIDILPI